MDDLSMAFMADDQGLQGYEPTADKLSSWTAHARLTPQINTVAGMAHISTEADRDISKALKDGDKVRALILLRQTARIDFSSNDQAERQRQAASLERIPKAR